MKTSVQSRITAYFVALTGILILVYAVALYLLVSRQFEHVLQRNIRSEAKWAEGLFRQSGTDAFAEWNRVTDETGIVFRLATGRGELLHDSGSEAYADTAPLDVALRSNTEKTSWSRATLGEIRMTVLTRRVSLPADAYVLQVAAPLRDLTELTSTVALWSLALVPALLLISVFAGFLYARRVLQPIEDGYRRMTQFTGDASHELRIPVAAITTTLEVPLRRERSASEYRTAIEDALEEARRLGGLVRDLLALARADAGTDILNREPLRLRDLLLDIEKDIGELEEKSGAKLRTGDLPDVLLRIDRGTMSRAILNLLDNAFKYSAAGGEVRIDARLDGGHVRINVSDDGPGIAKEDHARIFDRFFRVDKSRSHSRPRSGTGLGLAIVKSVVEAHGGDVSVDSEPGRGSTFTIRLPRD